MSKTCSEAPPPDRILVARTAAGSTMGAGFHASYFARPELDPTFVAGGLQATVDRVDDRMSTWKPDSDLNRLNRAEIGQWVALPDDLLFVLENALRIGRETEGAFDIAVGDAVQAWGFGPPERRPDAERIRAVLARGACSAPRSLELHTNGGRARRLREASFDLSGIAKGFGVDELGRCLEVMGVTAYMVDIDGEVRCGGRKPSGAPWTVAIESPSAAENLPVGGLELVDSAVATSGNYRNRIVVNGREVAHVIDPIRARPVAGGTTSATVVAADCMTADAWATALLVLPPDEGLRLVRLYGHEALLVTADQERLQACASGTAQDPAERRSPGPVGLVGESQLEAGQGGE